MQELVECSEDGHFATVNIEPQFALRKFWKQLSMTPFSEFHHSERVALAVKECLGFYPFRSLCPSGEGWGGALLGWVFVGDGRHPIHRIPIYCTLPHPQSITQFALLLSILVHYMYHHYMYTAFKDIQSMGRSGEKNMKGNKGPKMRAVSPNKVKFAVSPNKVNLGASSASLWSLGDFRSFKRILHLLLFWLCSTAARYAKSDLNSSTVTKFGPKKLAPKIR